MCRHEVNDPTMIDISDKNAKEDYKKVFRHLDALYSQAYVSPLVSSLGVPSTPTPSEASVSTLTDVPLNGASSTRTSTEERRCCMVIMASVSVWLVRGMLRVSSVVGREAQGQALDFLDEVIPALRKGFGLEQVVMPVHDRTKGLLEADEDVVQKRMSLKKRKTQLDEIR